jgi:hypothetical protein
MEIGFLLKKYARLGYSLKRTKEIILQVLKDDFSISVDPKDVEVKDNQVKLKISGVRRTEFVLLRSKIEESIQIKLKEEDIVVSKIF